eukprot:627755-Amphidinium_carterae.1
MTPKTAEAAQKCALNGGTVHDVHHVHHCWGTQLSGMRKRALNRGGVHHVHSVHGQLLQKVFFQG